MRPPRGFPARRLGSEFVVVEIGGRSYVVPAWQRSGNSAYLFVGAPTNWANAQANCATLGVSSNLVSILDAAERDFVSALNPTSATNRWIGARLIRTSTPQTAPFRYSWSDGSIFNFTSFRAGQPNDFGGSEDCLNIDNARPSLWLDVSCSLSRQYICKRPGLHFICPLILTSQLLNADFCSVRAPMPLLFTQDTMSYRLQKFPAILDLSVRTLLLMSATRLVSGR